MGGLIRTLRARVPTRMKVPWRVLKTHELPLTTRMTLIAPVVRGRGPIIKVRVGRGTCFLEASPLAIDLRTFREIFVDGVYRTDYTNKQVLDLGAHRGYFGAYALLQGASRVVSYEPEATNFALLDRTAKSFAASGSRWEVVHAAVGLSDGEAVLNLRDESWGHTLLDLGWVKHRGTQTVAVSSFERILQRFSLAQGPVIVKMDIEGFEGELVMATPPDVWAPVEELFIEIEPFCPVDRGRVIDRIQQAGLELVTTPSGSVHRFRR